MRKQGVDNVVCLGLATRTKPERSKLWSSAVQQVRLKGALGKSSNTAEVSVAGAQDPLLPLTTIYIVYMACVCSADVIP